MEIVHKESSYKWRAEILFWIITILATCLIILPVYYNTDGFPFLWSNVFYILVSLTFFRWIFFWKATPYAEVRWFMVALICIQPLLIFVLITLIQNFMLFLNDVGLYKVVHKITAEGALETANMIKTEILAFAAFSFIASITLFIRLIVRLWKIIKYS